LGMQTIFMDAGSGALRTVPEEMIAFVKGSIGVPLIIGGGIKSPEKARSILAAGADIIVVGNRFEEDPQLILEFAKVLASFNSIVNH